MQTPYVRPQENGARADVRWAELHAHDAALRIEVGPEPFWLTARRCTSEQLDAAEHTVDLVPGDTVWVALDHAQHSIGTQSCGLAPLPQYHLTASPGTSVLRPPDPGAGPPGQYPRPFRGPGGRHHPRPPVDPGLPQRRGRVAMICVTSTSDCSTKARGPGTPDSQRIPPMSRPAAKRCESAQNPRVTELRLRGHRWTSNSTAITG
jgi:hypothetical protein